MKNTFTAFLTACFFLLLPSKKISSQVIGGEITYEFIQGHTYEIKISLFSYSGDGFVDRPSIDSVHVGNNTVTFNRDLYYDFVVEGMRQSIYMETFTFPGAGNYTIGFVLPGRPGNTVNIPNSFFTPFAISTELIVSASCPNTSVDFSDHPIWFMQLNKGYRQNMAVLNPDHDSLSFELVSCLGESFQPIPGYFIPSGFSIDPISGELSSGGFDDTTGIFAFAVKITEWKDGIKSGSVLRDFIVDIHPDTINSYYFESPQITGIPYLTITINYVDSSTFPELNVYGEAFSVGNPAIANIVSGTSITATAQVTWNFDSTHARNHPYIFTFRGSNAVQKTDFTILVNINGPKPDSCYTAPIGIEEISYDNNFLLYPNPVSEKLTISCQPFSIDQIEIYNVLGNKTQSITGNCESCIVNCESFPHGIYFVKATSGNNVFFEKIIKQ